MKPATLVPETQKHMPQNRGSAESKLRRNPKHCPVCLAALSKIASRTRLAKSCESCRAHPSVTKTCKKCGANTVWEGKTGAGCRACGLHGNKSDVIATAELVSTPLIAAPIQTSIV